MAPSHGDIRSLDVGTSEPQLMCCEDPDVEGTIGTPTYEILDGAGIRCLRCGRTSYHQRDVEERYCSWCHIWHQSPGTGAHI